jgi:hypothetical protein
MSRPIARGLCFAAAVFLLLGLCCDPAAAQASAAAPASATRASGGDTGKASTPSPADSGSQVSAPDQGKPNEEQQYSPKKLSTEELLTLPAALLILLAGGFFGGLVDGFGTAVNYKFAIPRRLAASATAAGGEWELGFIGHGLVGVMAAFSIFAVSGVVFPGAESMSARNIEPIRLLSWALVAGYLGPRLLRLIASKLENLDELKTKQRATDQKVDEGAKLAGTTQQKLRESEEANPNLQDAQRWLTAYQVARDLNNPKLAQEKDYLGNAQRKFDLVLGQSPANVTALIGLANVCGARADLNKALDSTADSLADWNEGIAKLNEAVKADPRSAKAHYNRACFKAMANVGRTGKDNYPTAEIFADLRTAYELQPSFRDYAGQDTDFDALRATQGLNPADAALITHVRIPEEPAASPLPAKS